MRLYDYAASGNCYKVRLLLALTGRQVERVPVDIFAGDTLTPEFERLNFARETPVLELDDGTTIVQSNAILSYLAEGTPFLPADALGRAQVVQWLTFEQEHVMTGIAGARFRHLTGRQPEVVEQRLPVARRALDVLDAHLAGGPRAWIVGDAPTIADLSNYGYVHVAGDVGLDLAGDWPAVHAWTARIAALPGYANDLVPYPDNALPGAGRSIYG